MKKPFFLLLHLLAVPAFSQWSKMDVEVPDFTLSNVYQKNGRQYVASQDGIYKSADMGNSWTEIFTDLPVGVNVRLLGFFTTDSGLVVQAGNRYYASAGDESKWQEINNTTGRLYQGKGVSIYKHDQGTHSFSYSTDLGKSWIVSLKLPFFSRNLFSNRSAFFYQLDFSPKNSDTLLFTTDGKHFVKTVPAGLPAKGTTQWEFGFTPVAANEKYLFAHSNTGPKNLLYRLDLQSYVWTILHLPKDYASVHIEFMGNRMIISQETEMWISCDEGNTWNKFENTGINSSVIRGITEVAPQTYLAWTPEGIVKSTDNGNTWIKSIAGLPHCSDFYYLKYNNGDLLVRPSRSRNEVSPVLITGNGNDWRHADREETDLISYPVSALQNGTKFMLKHETGKLFLFRSLPGSRVWNKISGEIDGLTTLSTHGNTLFVEITTGGSHDHGVDGFSISALHRSTDEGQDFEDLSASLEPVNAVFSSISLIGSDSTFIYLEKPVSDTTKQIFRSLPSPINWDYLFTASLYSKIHLTKERVYVYDFLKDTLSVYESNQLKKLSPPANGRLLFTSPNSNTLYFTTDVSDSIKETLFQSTDFGNTWTPVSDNLPENTIVNYMDFSETEIFIATDKGLFRSALKPVVTQINAEKLVSETGLIQCYPLPASNYLNVTLAEEKDRGDSFTVQIKSVSGNVLGEFYEDKSSFAVNVSAYKSGMYFLSVQGKQKKYIKKFLVN